MSNPFWENGGSLILGSADRTRCMVRRTFLIVTQEAGLSWVTIKNVLRTMQRVLSADPRIKLPPFSQKGLDIPERDKLQMRIQNRQRISFSWQQANQIAEQVRK